MSTIATNVWPLNEEGQIVTEIGDGTTEVTSWVTQDKLPVSSASSKISLVIANLDDVVLNLPITGYEENAGNITEEDNILSAIQKLQGNITVAVDGSTGGTNTNDDAAEGRIGQIVTATKAVGAIVSLTNNTTANIVSISLTAGDWDITGVVDYVLTGATATSFTTSISTTSATVAPQTGDTGFGTDPTVTIPLITTLLSASYSAPLPTIRASRAITTTVYLVASASFSAGSVGAFGTIRARRVR